jgi:hypothetical protein
MKRLALSLACLAFAVSAAATTTVSITVDIPDADAVDVIASHREYFATNAIPNPTQAQIIARLKARLIEQIKAVTKAYRQRAASAGVVDPVAQ